MTHDMIDFAAAAIVDAPDVHDWPITTAITDVVFDGSTTRIEFTKKNGPPEIWSADYLRDPSQRWPNQANGGPPGDNFQYTIWLFRQRGGAWTGSAFVQMWFGRVASGNPGQPDVPSLFHNNWFYDGRWGALHDGGPIQPGERIGFMVTPGNGRNGAGPLDVHERSNVVVLNATDVGAFAFPAEAPAPPPITPPVPPPIVVPPIVPPLPPPIVAPPPSASGVTLDTLHADIRALIGVMEPILKSLIAIVQLIAPRPIK